MLGDVNLLPNSLPSLRTLSTSSALSAGLLGAIFAAAGPCLTDISITNGQAVKTALRLLEENDCAWAPTLQSLLLYWQEEQEEYEGDGELPLDLDTPRHVVKALARLPALRSLELFPREPDELVVRLLALAEGGGLQSLATLMVDDECGPALTAGAVLLLLLWLKREAKKALEGEGKGALWDVKVMASLLDDMHPSIKQITETHLSQLKEAHTQISKARGEEVVVVA